MTEQSPSTIGTVAQEAARLIEDMATMARSSYSRGGDSSRYAGAAAGEPVRPSQPDEAVPKQERRPRDGAAPDSPPQDSAPQNGDAQNDAAQDREAQDREAQDREAQDREAQHSHPRDRQSEGSGAGEEAAGVCSHCGADRGDSAGDGVSSNCTFCPLCRGIGLLRSVRPETVDLLADLAMSVAASLREVALRSRASDPASSAASTSGGPADPDRPPVQDIPVDDESEG